MTAVDLLEVRLDLLNVLRRLRVVAHFDGTSLALRWFGTADHDTPQIFLFVGLTRFEDRDIHAAPATSNAHREVCLHVLDGHAVLMEESTSDALSNLLFGCIFESLCAGDEIKNVTVGDNIAGLI